MRHTCMSWCARFKQISTSFHIATHARADRKLCKTFAVRMCRARAARTRCTAAHLSLLFIVLHNSFIVLNLARIDFSASFDAKRRKLCLSTLQFCVFSCSFIDTAFGVVQFIFVILLLVMELVIEFVQSVLAYDLIILLPCSWSLCMNNLET